MHGATAGTIIIRGNVGPAPQDQGLQDLVVGGLWVGGLCGTAARAKKAGSQVFATAEATSGLDRSGEFTMANIRLDTDPRHLPGPLPVSKR